jgi:hypothetical protein
VDVDDLIIEEHNILCLTIGYVPKVEKILEKY